MKSLYNKCLSAMSSCTYERIQVSSMLNNDNIFLILISLVLLSSHIHIVTAPDSEVDDESPFTYVEGNGKGPKEWGIINPGWQACGKGHYQSPINLHDQTVHVLPSLGEFKRDYRPAPAVVKNRGHDITVMWKGYAGSININGTSYQLLQCHWHSPSEHTFNGSRFELELHALHRSSSGNTAVVAIVYEYGHPDAFLSRVLHHIKSAGKEEKQLGIVNPGDIECGSSSGYYRYVGSLTTPPCTEGVVWTIVKKARTVSREQVRALKEKVHDGLKGNARPTQPLDGRPIWFYGTPGDT